MFVIGVDGGGTKTAALLTDARLVPLGRGWSGPANFLRVGLETAVASVLAAIQQACGQAGVTLSEITALGIGLGGVDHPTHHRRMREALSAALNAPPKQRGGVVAPVRWGPENLLLTTDADIALAGATDCQPGIVIISGTGSIAYGMNSRGQRARSGGWGPTFGDEGSGYDIARRALRAVVSSYDGRLQPTLLSDRICRHFGIESPADLPPLIYGNERVNIASLTELVIETARDGDTIAQHILRDAADELARAVIAVIRRLRMQQDEFRVCYVGSVFLAGEMILTPLGERVRAVAPRAILAPPLFPPTVGAIKLALGRLTLPTEAGGVESSFEPAVKTS
jgi:N-acetylglucosamine kinase